MRTLAGLHYSPWTEKARWALDHHRLDYTYREHSPMLGEFWLRRHTQPGQRPTVPLFLDAERSTTGSIAIARRAEALSPGTEPLFPASAAATIEHWEGISDRVLATGRAYILTRIAKNKRAQAEALPGFVPNWMRPAFAPMAHMGVSFIARKHQVPAEGEAVVQQAAVPAFDELRAALGGRPYLADRFTYADVTASVMLQFVRPVASRHLELKPGTREAWNHEALAQAYPDLLAWRDALYDKHRRPTPSLGETGKKSALG
ncbi:glutathione S-transferase C-terminal domain-containing protein [Corallococcus sp. M34]|uniref:glutathione S-transferase family protein n=1 Tax=Citreicoccus inhibens TaxID=2849499 RepID=UPI001C2122DC|nr:glutathione S-transferase C-terminal domain-containing protein [Citreicoccus inhibens]MBU8897147.1 glutathione S-transferase C-terminal domain-containing protein [Citreicoccus inhibens]